MRKVGGVVRARDLGAAAGAEVGELLQLVRDAELLTLLRVRALAQLWIEPRASSSAHCSTSLVSCRERARLLPGALLLHNRRAAKHESRLLHPQPWIR